MLSQRMAKTYLALGQGVRVRRCQDILERSMSLFERQLEELGAFAPRPDIRATYEQLAQQSSTSVA